MHNFNKSNYNSTLDKERPRERIQIQVLKKHSTMVIEPTCALALIWGRNFGKFGMIWYNITTFWISI